MGIQKRTVMRVFFVAELVLFAWFYQYGVSGMHHIEQLYEENKQCEQKIQVLSAEIAQKERELTSWQNDSFYKEQLAREQLHMAKEGEEIYLVAR